MAMNAKDWVRMLDQDLADAVKAYHVAERLLQRSRLRMIHLMGAIRRHPAARVQLSNTTCRNLEQALVSSLRSGHQLPRKRKRGK